MCVFFVRMCMALRNVCVFADVVWLLRTFLNGFCVLSGLYVRIQILCVKRIVHTDTAFAH